MKKYNVGDRVRVYGHPSVNKESSLVGTVAVTEDPLWRKWDYILVEDERGHGYYAHPNQCRRLVKKKPREFWLTRSKCGREFYVSKYDPKVKPGEDEGWEVLRVRVVPQ